MDKMTLEKLDYNKLKEIVKGYCVSGLGKKLIDKLEPSNNMKVVKNRLEETSEGRRLIEASYHIPLDGIFNVNPLIDKIEKGASLEPSDLTMMSDFLRGCRRVKSFIKNKEGYAKILCSYGENIAELSYIEEEINRCIKGSIVDSNATKELRKIRQKMDECEDNINQKLSKFLKNSEYKKYIQEFFVSKRNGRFTIPIKSAYKNNVPGEIIETSSKGLTVFMEPSVVKKYSSELEVLKVEEKVEEYKILGNITEMLNDRIKDIKINIEIISEYDMIYAKAKYSKDISGINPKLNNRGYVKIINGRYPLIEKSVPLNIEIGNNYRSLIITGPNAGGKTVVLKTVGLLTLAVQSGFHIAADEGTKMSIFDNVFVDIGDNQSVENAAMEFKKDTLEPLYRLSIGKSGDSNALYIAKKMGIPDRIIEKSNRYIETKEYDYKLLSSSKVSKDLIEEKKEDTYQFVIGDKVLWLDKNKSAVVYKEKDRLNNVIIFVDKQFIEVNSKRLKLEIKAEELYPDGYDLNQIFVSFKDRKLEKDIERGSKKAIKKIIKKNKAMKIEE